MGVNDTGVGSWDLFCDLCCIAPVCRQASWKKIDWQVCCELGHCLLFLLCFSIAQLCSEGGEEEDTDQREGQIQPLFSKLTLCRPVNTPYRLNNAAREKG